MFLLSTVSTAVHEILSGDGSVDLIIEDQLHKHELPVTATRPETTPTVTQTPSMNLNTQNGDTTAANMPTVTRKIEGEAVKAKKSSTITTARAIMPTSMPLTTTMSPSINATTITTLAVPHLARVTAPAKRSKLSWDEATTQTSTQPPKKTKEQGKLDSRSRLEENELKREGLWYIDSLVLLFTGICKDTLASIADPVTHNSYGKKEGAWMKDPKGNGKVIYVTDYYYGNQLLEFRDMDTFKQGTCIFKIETAAFTYTALFISFIFCIYFFIFKKFKIIFNITTIITLRVLLNNAYFELSIH